MRLQSVFTLLTSALVASIPVWAQPGPCDSVGGVLITNIAAIDGVYNLGPVFGAEKGGARTESPTRPTLLFGIFGMNGPISYSYGFASTPERVWPRPTCSIRGFIQPPFDPRNGRERQELSFRTIRDW